MDFFERQARARRNTKLLVCYFVLAVGFIVVAVNVAVAVVFSLGHDELDSFRSLWNPSLFVYVAAATLSVIVGGSVYKTLELAQGGRAVATMLGGRPINRLTTDPDERRLLNVVEEMAIASGTPVPEVYLLAREEGINAFAAGNSTSDAVMGVTKGCIKLLNRDELQGVIAHEFSHILNGDMRLNLRLIGLVSGILLLAIIGRVLLRTRGRRNPLPLLGLFLLAIGLIGVFFARLIKSAVSRQREYLADAAAVQFTRNPDGLAGALKKIGGLLYGSRLQSPAAEEASHLFFGNGLAESWAGMMSTHPPLVDRIRALDPSFDGHFARIGARRTANGERGRGGQGSGFRVQEEVRGAEVRGQEAGRPALEPRAMLAAQLAASASGTSPPITSSMLPRVGRPEPKHLRYAAEFRAALPEPLLTASRESLSATALVYVLLLSQDTAARQEQLNQLQQRLEPPVYREVIRLLPAVDPLPVSGRLPMLMLTVPALRDLASIQYEQFKATVEFLVEFDREINLFEYALRQIVVRHVDPYFGQGRKAITQYYVMKPLLGGCSVLLSALARLGQETPAEMQNAFRQGVECLGEPVADLRFLDAGKCGLTQIDAALKRLSQAAPMLKKKILTACAFTVVADQVIQPEEAELLRAIADLLDCPVPPLVEGV